MNETNQAEIDALKRQLADERARRDKFLSILSHDLRAPLNASRMNAQMLARKADLPEAMAKHTQTIITNIDRANHVLQDFLDVSQILSGKKLEISPEPCSLNEVFGKIIRRLELQYGNRISAIDDCDVHGSFDAEALNRIVENLVSNGLRYGSSDRPVVSRLTQVGDRAVISVHNYGSFLEPAERERLIHLKNVELAMGDSRRGFGLILTRAVIEAHGGSFEVDSSPTEGTTFRVLLPIEQVSSCYGIK